MRRPIHPLQPIGRVFAGLPPPLVAPPLGLVAARLRRSHARALSRIPFDEPRRLLVEATDVGARLLVVARRGDLRLRAAPVGAAVEVEAVVSGPLGALLDIATGASDGDALFFSRELTIEGDTELVVALRNAFDDAHVDLAGLIGIPGPVRRPLARLAHRARRDLGRLAEVLGGIEDMLARGTDGSLAGVRREARKAGR